MQICSNKNPAAGSTQAENATLIAANRPIMYCFRGGKFGICGIPPTIWFCGLFAILSAEKLIIEGFYVFAYNMSLPIVGFVPL